MTSEEETTAIDEEKPLKENPAETHSANPMAMRVLICTKMMLGFIITAIIIGMGMDQLSWGDGKSDLIVPKNANTKTATCTQSKGGTACKREATCGWRNMIVTEFTLDATGNTIGYSGYDALQNYKHACEGLSSDWTMFGKAYEDALCDVKQAGNVWLAFGITSIVFHSCAFLIKNKGMGPVDHSSAQPTLHPLVNFCLILFGMMCCLIQWAVWVGEGCYANENDLHYDFEAGPSTGLVIAAWILSCFSCASQAALVILLR